MQSFHERFDITIDPEKAEQDFVVRAKHVLMQHGMQTERLHDLLDELVYCTAVDLKQSVTHISGKTFLEWKPGNLMQFVDELDFRGMLVALETLYHWYAERLERAGDTREKMGLDQRLGNLDDMVSDLVRRSGGSLGIRWADGTFYPAGAPELDDALVNDQLRWLRQHNLPSVAAPLEKSLRHLLNADRSREFRQDAITDAYEALESLAKIVVQRDKDLSGIRQSLASTLKMDATYSEMLKHYVDRGCQFRHGTPEPRPVPDHAETEMFVYLTGVFIRFAVERRDRWAPTD